MPDTGSLDDLIASGVIADMPVLVLGRGSNLVVSDGGVRWAGNPPRTFIRPRRSRRDRGACRRCRPLAQVARSSVEAGLTGLEFFIGVPGSVGGAVRQSAGCFGTETRDCLVEASIVDLRDGIIGRFGPDDLELSYRHSNVTSTRLVLAATFRSRPGDVDTGRAELRRITRWRRDNQPGGTFNAGSVFKNRSATAGEIIDSLGLKGMRVGDVAVSEKHANFFVAGSSATSEDIRRLVVAVKDRVFEQTGTMLEPEIQFVGFDDEN